MRKMTVDCCLQKISNRFELVMILSKRAKQLIDGKKPLVENKGEKSILTSMREVTAGKVFFIKNDEDE